MSGAAGQIGYSLLPLLCGGEAFGGDVAVSVRLLEVPQAIQAARGVAMELRDAGYGLLREVSVTSSAEEAFAGAQVAVLLGGFPRGRGMERSDLIGRNAAIMREHGLALNRGADGNCKVVVVANPANTNALLVSRFAPRLRPENITALTRLDEQRLRGMIAEGLGLASARDVRGATIWGNHSSTQVPDCDNADVRLPGDETWQRLAPALRRRGLRRWAEGELVRRVRGRGAAVIAARKRSSAMSAAAAVAAHLRSWLGERTEQVVSMAVMSDGNAYPAHVPAGLVFSFPVRCGLGRWEIAGGRRVSARLGAQIRASADELRAERAAALAFLKARL